MAKDQQNAAPATAATDEAFLQVLNGCADACANMDLSDDNWKPPDAKYDVAVESVESGTKEKNGVLNAWVKAVFTILDGDFAGKTFSDYFWIPPGVSEPTMSLRNMARLATCLAGHEVKDPIACAAIINDAAGQEFLTLELYSSVSKKTQKTYRNIRYLARIDSSDEGTANATA